MKYLLDTNIVTAVLKKEPPSVAEELKKLLNSDSQVVICAVVYYEIKRGFLYQDAKRQLSFFEVLVDTLNWRDVDRKDWEEAASIWESRRRKGQSQGDDADILIAAVARLDKAILVTRNSSDFPEADLALQSWS